MKRLVLLLVVLALITGLSAAFAEKEVSIYSSLQEDEIAYYFQQFEKDTGIHVNYLRLSAGEMVSRIIAEKENPQVSIIFGGGLENYITAEEAGVLEEYTPNGIEAIPAEYVTSKYWTPIYNAIMCLCVNLDWFEENHKEFPKKWEDLIDPDYQNLVMIAHPSTSGVASNFLTSMAQYMGEEKAFEYFRQLKKIVPYFAKASYTAPTAVSLGEAALGLTLDSDALRFINEGYNVDFIFPDPTFTDMGAVALVKGAPEAEEGKAFIDWIISVPGQECYKASGAARLPINPNAEMTPGLKPASEAHFFDKDIPKAGQDRARLIQRFIEEVDDATDLH